MVHVLVHGLGLVLPLIVGLVSMARADPLRGFGDLQLYRNASSQLVGAQAFVSFSSASAHGPLGQSISGHAAPAPEALCNCACFALDDFAWCQNTAKTTVGVSTFSYSPFARRWEGRALRYFAEGSAGDLAGRGGNSFVETAVLPDGPGGAVYFEVAYVGDTSNDTVACGTQRPCRSAELVRGFTTAVDCAHAALCDAQCAGVAQYDEWRKNCSFT